ncbi:DUF4232 domain-containing protein [Actinosynnema pretiosum]|uniref:DUF4232 domain-containing protein n=1 Tax=Actinosynnema pretiosum TaxID=42197 RepID=UPI0012FE26FE|nr:DUF4232 domain-containing protein [Actinosynnema pretiosum]
MAAGLAVVALVGACQTMAPDRLGQPGTGSPPAPSDRPSSISLTGTSRSMPASDSRCATAELRVDIGQNGNHDMQGAHVPLRFTNTGTGPCTLHGAPGVSYVAAEGGEQVGEPATRDTDGPEVTLAPGETASAGLFLSSAPLKTPACEQVVVPGLRVYPPGGTESVFVAHESTACEPPRNGPFLGVGPVEPGADNTGY